MNAISPRAQALRKSALDELAKAFEEARGALPADWVKDGDPDLVRLRQDGDLELLINRYASVQPERSTDGEQATDDEQWGHVMARYLSEDRAESLRGYPDRPWGNPEDRATGWAVLAVASLEAAILYGVFSELSNWAPVAGLAVLALFAAARGVFAWNDARRTTGSKVRTNAGGRT